MDNQFNNQYQNQIPPQQYPQSPQNGYNQPIYQQQPQPMYPPVYPQQVYPQPINQNQKPKIKRPTGAFIFSIFGLDIAIMCAIAIICAHFGKDYMNLILHIHAFYAIFLIIIGLFILSFFVLNPVFSIIGLMFSSISLVKNSQYKKEPTAPLYKKRLTISLVFSIIGIVFNILNIIIFILFCLSHRIPLY